jgi:iron complex outermembrane receptor protein
MEVIRGPASAVWGANAMNGVVNFISKTPRELNGNSATISFGAMNRDVDGGQQLGTGSMFAVSGTHARAVNDRWAYKISAGGFTSDPLARPTGTIPNGTGTQYPNYTNQGTTQPKFDARVDYDAANYKLVFAGGYSGTEGIFHTGIGPFDSDGVGIAYGNVRYSRGGLRFNVFTNQLNGDATGLLAIGTNGQPILFQFNTQTYDVEIGNVNTLGTSNVLSYGGNVRYNSFDLSIAPRGDQRTELGFYVQDEFFMNDRVRLNLGARIDKFDNIDDAVFSPRVALILKPLADHAIRVSYNKAFRSPSLINNYLETTIINQLNLGLINPALSGVTYNFPVRAVGNESLSEESIDSLEVGYTGVINKRATVSAAVYWTTNQDEIFFTQTGRYRAAAPPPGWPLPPVVLEVLPPPCTSATCTTGGLPSEFSYRNLGKNKNKGFELGVDGAVNAALNLFANYSYQAEPEPDFDISEINLPPTNRFNVGLSYSQSRYLGNFSVSYVDDAYYQDVLDARFAGPTEAYTQVNGAFGVKFMNDRLTTTVKVINLLNEDIQSHVFGDILKRQVIGEVRVQF